MGYCNVNIAKKIDQIGQEAGFFTEASQANEGSGGSKLCELSWKEPGSKHEHAEARELIGK